MTEPRRTRLSIGEIVKSNSSPAETRRKLAALLLLALFAIAAAFQLQPSYIVLDIPVKSHLGGGDFWWERQGSELSFADESGVLFLYRQVGTAYPEAQGWSTADEIFAYFDAWLKQRGWTRVASVSASPTLPESRFLQQSNLRRYYPAHGEDKWVELAIWPIGGGVDGFNVVVVAVRRSWLNQFGKGFD